MEKKKELEKLKKEAKSLEREFNAVYPSKPFPWSFIFEGNEGSAEQEVAGPSGPSETVRKLSQSSEESVEMSRRLRSLSLADAQSDVEDERKRCLIAPPKFIAPATETEGELTDTNVVDMDIASSPGSCGAIIEENVPLDFPDEDKREISGPMSSIEFQVASEVNDEDFPTEKIKEAKFERRSWASKSSSVATSEVGDESSSEQSEEELKTRKKTCKKRRSAKKVTPSSSIASSEVEDILPTKKKIKARLKNESIAASSSVATSEVEETTKQNEVETTMKTSADATPGCSGVSKRQTSAETAQVAPSKKKRRKPGKGIKFFLTRPKKLLEKIKKTKKKK